MSLVLRATAPTSASVTRNPIVIIISKSVMNARMLMAFAMSSAPLLNRARLGVPDVARILANRSVRGKFPRVGDVKNHFSLPFMWVGVQLQQILIRFQI